MHSFRYISFQQVKNKLHELKISKIHSTTEKFWDCENLHRNQIDVYD